MNTDKAEVSYSYNASGLRKSKTVNSETSNFIWNGQNMIAETGENDAIQNTYTYDMTGVILRNDSDWYLKNAHGDVVGMVDSGNNLILEYRYDAYGNQIGMDEEDTNPFRYNGEYWDGETENIYLRNRSYSPADGRFTSEDPVKDGTNWYSYCAGNPVMFSDASGLKAQVFGRSQTGEVDFNNLPTATEEERMAFQMLLQATTRDTVTVLEDGTVQLELNDSEEVLNAPANVRRDAGTAVLRSIVLDERNTVILQIGPTDGLRDRVQGQDLNTHVVHMTMESGKDLFWDFATNSVQLMENPASVILQHEFIHTLRVINGDVKEGSGYYSYIDEYGNQQYGVAPIEELETSGIDYYTGVIRDHNGNITGLTGNFVQASKWAISESAIRREHMMGDRIRYYVSNDIVHKSDLYQ